MVSSPLFSWKEETQLYTIPGKKEDRICLPPHDLYPNRIIGLFGPSGSGKSTILQYLYDQSKQNGVDCLYVKQDIVLYPTLTVEETLLYYIRLRGQPQARQLLSHVLRVLNLKEARHRCIGSVEQRGLSGGERKRVMLALVLLDTRASLYLLDEPFTEIGQENTRAFATMLKRKAESSTIVFATHDLPIELEPLSERWEIIPENHTLQYHEISITRDIESEFAFDLDSTTITSSSLQIGRFQTSNIVLSRHLLLQWKSKKMLFVKILVPCLILLLQSIFLGFFQDHLRTWETSGTFLDLFRVLFHFIIVLFTLSILPLHTLSDHYGSRSVILHEIRQGFYSRGVYVSIAVLYDQCFLFLLGILLGILSYGTHPMVWMTYTGILCSAMMFTNMMMWFLSFYGHLSHHTVLLSMAAYLSLSFVINLGFLQQYSFTHFIQYLSMLHIQSRLLLEVFLRYIPHLTENQTQMLQYVISLLDNGKEDGGISTWIGWGLCLWGVFPLTMMIMSHIPCVLST